MNQFLSWLAQKKLTAVPEPWVHMVHTALGAAGMALVSHLTHSKVLGAVAVLGVAAVIEFWFDATYEKQAFGDNYHDFTDYALGVFVVASLG